MTKTPLSWACVKMLGLSIFRTCWLIPGPMPEALPNVNNLMPRRGRFALGATQRSGWQVPAGSPRGPGAVGFEKSTARLEGTAARKCPTG